MKQIDNLSKNARQKTTVALDDGTVVVINFRYLPTIQRWQISVTRGDFTVDGIGLVVCPNLLRSWKNVIPFGLAVSTFNGQDPTFLEDLQDDRTQLYILTQDDVAAVERDIYGANS